ncbi:MAG: hypothetical protein H8E35_05420 [Ardenticatenia bacterium]|nr:hypothetical protein [Ardenticatenia bacterium]
MQLPGRVVFFGFLVWLIPFVVAVLIFPLKDSQPALFESLMPVVITLCVTVFLALYFRKIETGFVQAGVVVGIIWFFMSLVIDLLMFMWGPMKMTFADYMMDIGLTYLIMPIITVGAGYIVENK